MPNSRRPHHWYPGGDRSPDSWHRDTRTQLLIWYHQWSMSRAAPGLTHCPPWPGTRLSSSTCHDCSSPPPTQSACQSATPPPESSPCRAQTDPPHTWWRWYTNIILLVTVTPWWVTCTSQMSSVPGMYPDRCSAGMNHRCRLQPGMGSPAWVTCTHHTHIATGQDTGQHRRHWWEAGTCCRPRYTALQMVCSWGHRVGCLDRPLNHGDRRYERWGGAGHGDGPPAPCYHAHLLRCLQI